MAELRVRRLDSAQGLPALKKYSGGASGFDLCATRTVDVPVGARVTIGTGIAVEVPHGMEGQVRPRSGLAARSGVTVLNSPGTVDNDFRGEIEVILINLGQDAVTICRGDRIAQLVVVPVATDLDLRVVDELTPTDRGTDGFGSTGTGPHAT